ncbi:MAG: DNA repair protein RadA, partial [Acetivibrio sp.]
MAKNKMVFFCKECGYESSKWMGQCPGCKEWDSFVEEPTAGKSKSVLSAKMGRKSEPEPLSKVITGEDERILTG